MAGCELEHDHDVSISVGVDAPGVLEATRRMSAMCEAWGISVLSVREGADEDEEEEEAVADGADADGEPREGEEDEERGGIVFTQAEESGAFAKGERTPPSYQKVFAESSQKTKRRRSLGLLRPRVAAEGT